MLIREFLWGNDLKAFLLLKSAIFVFPHERHLKPTTATTTWNSKQKPKSAIFCFFSHSFSQKTATVNQSEVDEYTITCSRSFEQNTVCVIFSPNVFAKMGLENSDSYMSNQVSLKDFRKWLIKSCTKDLEMQKKNITLKIKK